MQSLSVQYDAGMLMLLTTITEANLHDTHVPLCKQQESEAKATFCDISECNSATPLLESFNQNMVSLRSLNSWISSSSICALVAVWYSAVFATGRLRV